jgi:crotonobetaine/carnitine-CoA ligase
VTVAFNTQLKGDALEYLVKLSDAKLLVIASDFVTNYDAITPRISGIRSVIFDTSGKDGAGTINRLFKESSDTLPLNLPAMDDIEPLIVTFTSGTTGLPKLVRNCHRAFITAAVDLANYAELSPNDRIYTALPLYHVNPQVYCILTGLVMNGSVAIAPRFSASRFFDDMRKYQATAFTYVGAVLPILLTQPESPNDRNQPAKKCFGGGAPKDVYERIAQRFGVQVLELYGMSETGSWNTINRPGREKSGSVGMLREGFDIRIFDDGDNEVPIGNMGEIVVRPMKSYIMFDGYYKLPEETIKCSQNWWFHTGDLGKIDEEGYYYFMGRKKESIRRGGENIPPYDIEREINKHPAVLESAAFGIFDPIMEEEIKIAIVLRTDRTVKPEEIIAWCEPRLPKFMVPRYIEFMEQLPKSSSEKIQKLILKKQGITPNTWDKQKKH